MLLPVALVLATLAVLGSYYETSDDGTLAWLFSGVLALKPVSSVPLYFHGYGHALAAAYSAVPGVAWFGLLNSGLLLLATVLVFAVLDGLFRVHFRLESRAPILALVLFFCVAWVEHWLWFSHVRAGILLAGAGVVFAAQRPTKRWALLVGLACVLGAWLMRPALAVLGVGIALPAAFLLAGSWRRAWPVVVGSGLVLVSAFGMAALVETPADQRAQRQYQSLARILDFRQLEAQPQTPADSLGTAAVELWLLGDTAVVNESLIGRVYVFNARAFIGSVVPAKLAVRAGLLVRDYFPMLLALAVTVLATTRRPERRPEFWLVQIGFLGLLILFAGLLKLPPRLALPILDFWLLTNLVFLANTARNSLITLPLTAPEKSALPTPFRQAWPPLLRRLFGGLGVLALALYATKTIHRRHVLGAERQRHETALQQLNQRTRGTVLVLGGTTDLLKSLSPFRVYYPSSVATLLLTGWQTQDPSQPRLRQRLLGTADQTAALSRLARASPTAQWLLTAETARWLNRRFRYKTGTESTVDLRPLASLPADTSYRFYQPAVR
ncbi:hypothetical protein I2I05_09525 [Hymenobacter sp. BT683]|uniref:Glycosyltransferase RgtA/B/C/D-like domain-containing protein n=1 Tax=Hymenobacter jeongseonensis TaxID=2791027 RepID=A0ABS0IH00_9BACT|nr:hypothetical protein [Hymenobacter jeongseonensis]MBF9237633.1 hypothetical protein [Hymenobacter jeongseonensis]